MAFAPVNRVVLSRGVERPHFLSAGRIEDAQHAVIGSSKNKAANDRRRCGIGVVAGR